MPYDVPPPRSTPSWEACKNALPRQVLGTDGGVTSVLSSLIRS
jgi:hypothetical protein